MTKQKVFKWLYDVVRNNRTIKWFKAIRRIMPQTRYMVIASAIDHQLMPTRKAAEEFIRSNGLNKGTDIVPVWISDIEVLARTGGEVQMSHVE